MKVSFHRGLTISLGNYESERIDVGAESECEPGQERLMYNQLKSWVDERLEEAADEHLQAGLGRKVVPQKQ